MTIEKDPHGKDPHELGAKLDHGKLLGGLIGDFGLALEEVCRVATYGAQKYTRGGWAHVPDGPARYYDAFWRHLFKTSTEKIDPPSGMSHKAMMIWNLLASLELELRGQPPKQQTVPGAVQMEEAMLGGSAASAPEVLTRPLYHGLTRGGNGGLGAIGDIDPQVGEYVLFRGSLALIDSESRGPDPDNFSRRVRYVELVEPETLNLLHSIPQSWLHASSHAEIRQLRPDLNVPPGRVWMVVESTPRQDAPEVDDFVMLEGWLCRIQRVYDDQCIRKVELHPNPIDPVPVGRSQVFFRRPRPGEAIRYRAGQRPVPGAFWVYDEHTSGGHSDQTDAGRVPAQEQSATAGNPEVCPRDPWPAFHMKTAAFYAGRSKDPTTHVGAVAVGADNRVIEIGYNGLPQGVQDLPERMERPEKYDWTCHAEENLVATAARARLSGTTVFVTHLCCNRCMAQMINAGVKKIVVGDGQTSMPPHLFDVAVTMANEAKVELVRLDGTPITLEDGSCCS